MTKQQSYLDYAYKAREYRDGKGVDKDIDLAIEYMRKGTAGKQTWPKNELADLLFKRGKPEDYAEAFELNTALAEKGDASAMARLARMYRDGKGVDMDIDLAIEYMKKANSIKQTYSSELNKLLFSRASPEDVDALIMLESEAKL